MRKVSFTGCAWATKERKAKSARNATGVGQVGNLRGGWLPPPADRPIANRPQVDNLPHKMSATLSVISVLPLLDGNCNKWWAHKRTRELLRGADRLRLVYVCGGCCRVKTRRRGS